MKNKFLFIREILTKDFFFEVKLNIFKRFNNYKCTTNMSSLKYILLVISTSPFNNIKIFFSIVLYWMGVVIIIKKNMLLNGQSFFFFGYVKE